MTDALPTSLRDRYAAIDVICRQFGVARLDVFGSAAGDRFDPGTSDYDFIVSFSPRAQPSLARRFIGLADALESALGRPVDLLTDQPVENPYLRHSIESTRRSVYVEPPAQAPA